MMTCMICFKGLVYDWGNNYAIFVNLFVSKHRYTHEVVKLKSKLVKTAAIHTPDDSQWHETGSLQQPINSQENHQQAINKEDTEIDENSQQTDEPMREQNAP